MQIITEKLCPDCSNSQIFRFFYSWYCCLSSRLTPVIVLLCTLCSFVQINGTKNENIYFVQSPSPSCLSCRKRTPPLLLWRWRSLSTNMWSALRETPCRRFWIELASQLRSHLLTAAQKLSSFVESPTVWVRLSLKFMPRYIYHVKTGNVKSYLNIWELRSNDSIFPSTGKQLHCFLGLSSFLASSFHYWEEGPELGKDHSTNAQGVLNALK